MSNTSRKTLLVACGGSGIKTLIRFNEMMSGNAEWRKRLPRDVAYLAVDTEVNLTQTFEASVAMQMGGVRGDAMPLIKLVQITKELGTIGDIVDNVFYGREDDPAFARLRPHWWFSPDGKKPFRSMYVRGIERGAGQSGPVSYLCTWNKLPKFEAVIDDLLDQLKRRNPDQDDPLADMQVYFISGLAGGTGRGTWFPAAFKIRTYLEQKGYRINPSGIFFERGCFPNVGKSDRDMDLGMKVNSITGLSELSSWMRIHEDQEQYFYNLPDLVNPGINEDDPSGPAATDVIQVSPNEKDPFQRSPLDSAYLICSDSGHGRLEDNEQYHHMAAAALYSLVAGSQFIEASAINKLKNFGSLGATTFEVNTVQLNTFFEAELRKNAVERVRVKAEKGSSLDKEADALLAALADEDHPMHGLSLFSVPGKLGINDIAAMTSSQGCIVTRAIANLRAEHAQVHTAFTALLDKQKPKPAWDYVVKTLAAGDITKDKVNQAIDEAMKSLRIDDLETALRALVREAYSSPELGTTASLGRAINVANKLSAMYKKSIELLNDKIVYGQESYSQEKDLCGRFKPDFDEKAGPNWFTDGKIRVNFTKEEQKYLTAKFSWLYNCALFFKIRPILGKRFEEAVKSMERIISVCDELSKVLGKVQKNFEKQADTSAGTHRAGIGAFEMLFTEPTSKAMLADIPARASSLNLFKRVLKPIMSRDAVRDLLLAEDSSVIRHQYIDVAMISQFGQLLSQKELPGQDYLAEVQISLENLFTSNVFLANGFMDRNFSFETVLRANIPHWDRLIEDKFGNMKDFEDLCQRFIAYLGINPLNPEDVEEGVIPKIKLFGLIDKIVVSLVGACRPWVQLDRSAAKDYLETIALLPVRLSDERAIEVNKLVNKEHQSQNVSVVHLGSDSEGGYRLPTDRIVIFASQNIAARRSSGQQALDLVESISYWKEPKVKAALELAECPDARAYFEPNKTKTGFVERERGLGFVSPIYVNEPKLSAHRWRPWRPEETVDMVEERMKSIDDALLYAFLGVDVKAGEKAVVDDVAERFNWSLPLVAMGGGRSETFSFTRDPLVWAGGKGEDEQVPSWEKGEEFITSIDNLYAYFKGEGKPGLEGSKLVAAQKAGREQLEQLSAEVEAFNRHIVPEIGASALNKLMTARGRWLTARERAASKEDKPFWRRLQQAARNQRS